MAPDRAILLSASAEPVGPATEFQTPCSDPLEVLALLQAGHLDRGMRGACECLALDFAQRAARGTSLQAPAPALLELLRQLRENPFLRAALAQPYGYEGDPAVMDFALELAPLPADTTPLGLAMYHWMCAHSATFAAFRARRRYLAARLEHAAAAHPGAVVAGLFAGHGRELPESRAWRESRVEVQLIDFDTRVLAKALYEHAGRGKLSTRPSTLADILAGRLPLTDCALIYAPSVAEQLPDNTLAQLLETLIPSLRPYGEIVMPAFSRMPEPGLLELAADWQPNTRHPGRLLRLAHAFDDATAVVHDEPANGIAYLHVQRRPRGALTGRGGVAESVQGP